ncbi:helix-turn-helix domain-containing protein [Rossellomorea sp. H39__3]
MNEMPMKIGDNIRKIRKERGLSLDQVADRTGVSKAMIGQIERDDSNPTVATLWKIANGLKVSFSSLLEAPAADVAIIDYKDVEPVLEDGESMWSYRFSHSNRQRNGKATALS